MNPLDYILPYVNSWANYLKSQGLASQVSDAAAKLYLLLYLYGLGPTITSVYRSEQHQAELLARWNAGDRAGLVYKPAIHSDHSLTVSGSPASKAIDIDLRTKNYSLGAQIAHAIGVKTGYEIGDPVHYFFR
jgi:hypothetical protein